MCLSVCLFVRMSRSLLSCIKSVWKARDIVRTVLARACYIPSFKKFYARVQAISRNFTQFSCNLGYFSHFWANFNMLGIKMHVLELRNSLVILSKNFTCVFTQFHAIFTLFGLFQPFLGQFQHVGYQKACTRAKKFIGNTFKKFHARVHAISRNFHTIWAISAIFCQFQHVAYQKECTRAEKSISDTFTQFHARLHAISRKFHAIFTQFGLFQPFFGPISTCWL